MRLGTHLECIGRSLNVSRACQDGAREFVGRKLRLVGRLSGVAERLAENDVVGPHWKFARRFIEGIGKLAGNTLKYRQKKTKRLITRMPEAVGLAGLNCSYPGFWVLLAVDPPRPATELPVHGFYSMFEIWL
ncbi:hypothetical protein GW17_00052303 [Ensete ventricosum]|nr:hypothetical protein GW17_00052303 [Ensete ventricosum]RZS11560.1 hypothetical protein BHM03_00042921 [Ensete ventricosum]